MSILVSFKFCGPIFRFSQYLHGLLDGRWDGKCTLWAKDDLHDVSDVLNDAARRSPGVSAPSTRY